MPPDRLESALSRARGNAPFLDSLLAREPQITQNVDAFRRDPLLVAAQDIAPETPMASRLRIERRRVALGTALCDLSGACDLMQVTRILSDFADNALDRAIRTAIFERTPDAEPRGFAAIAMGKLGGRELNYSSDIDLIFLADPETLPRRTREEPGEAAMRVGRRVVELLQTRDADGYVFRVDLRLRPSPEATPIALPVDAAISYYESQALAWERAAFIRSRVAAGDRALGEYFLEAIHPFIWRRALDFGAIREIRAISHRIRDHYSQTQRFGPGYDLKRGRGGIREIEFFAQIHQLIHGGRDPGLRVPATLRALAALADAGWIDGYDAGGLAAAYDVLRRIEHRAQMIDDRQTHILPEDAEALDRVAALDGVANGRALLEQLRPQVERVGRIYDGLVDDDGETARLPQGTGLEKRLADAGFADVPNALHLIEKWRSGRYPALRTGAARDALEDALPGMIDAFADAPEPAAALARVDTLLSRLPSAINFFRLLEAQPALARLLSTILSHAPTLSEALARRAELLDGLIDATALDPMPATEVLAAEMARREPGSDYQWLLDHVRRIVGERRFALGAQIVAGVSDPLEVSAGYARVAEAAIDVLAEATVAEFEADHGRVPGCELVVLALGRMGGGALTHASDLDLVYLFTGDYSAESNGRKPLGAVTYFNRLGQRISSALSAPTAAGPLYEVDTRLRPSGAQGPLAVSLEGFRRYQEESAWTWEHMALTRARPIFGSDAARAETAKIINRVLNGARPERDIAADATRMRREMAAHKPPSGPLDVKLLDGGLVDLEFTVQVLQLTRHTALDPDLGDAIDALIGEGLLPRGLREAHDFLSRLLVTMRLVAPDCDEPSPPTRKLLAHAVGAESWEAAVASLEATRQEVRQCWAAVRRESDGE
ncbi:bifunctional [glutamine synthetase] adenylyltransferase/[glutamine synthetase]-adenylyl-L-tyrosine phosphorylase [Stakelama tenebrarum]|uniref:bifunctional [glutamine synthetase] adenylyltransferase/[glutamine synthetase]-adenylyl-L-tyrosine phosphorylase n=1 Tax=Stakelama tenebrarum TaxID=2711215 RepID=UPI00389A3FC6